MSRRRKIVVSIIGGLAVAIGGLIAAFFMSSPTAVELSLDAPIQEIPPDWFEEESSTTQTTAERSGDEAAPVAAVEPTAPAGPIVTTGRLMMLGDGKPFGEEAYELAVSEDRMTLHSSGRFWFKVLVATIQITFEQTLEGGADLQPISYAAEFHAPLGFDRSVRVSIEADRALVEESDETEEIPIDPERTAVLGTFSTYVLLPRLASLRSEDGPATFDVLVFGGPPGRGPSDADTDSLPIMTVERVGTAFLRTSDLRLEVDRYLVTSDLGESELYARGDEFLALHAGDSDDPLWVYRSDFFPDGIEVVNAAPLP